MVEEKLDQILSFIGGMEQNMKEMEQNMKEMKQNMKEMKQNMKEMKQNMKEMEQRLEQKIVGLQTQVQEFKDENNKMWKENERLHLRTITEFESLKTSIHGIVEGFEEYMDEKIREQLQRMDANEQKYQAVEYSNYIEHQIFKRDINKIKIKNNIKEIDEELEKKILQMRTIKWE